MIQQPEVSVPRLLKQLAFEVKTFLRQETELAKTEMAQKFSELGSDATWLGIGAVAGYAGFVILLTAFGILAAFGFERLQLDFSLAMFAGFAAIGLLTVIIGAVMLVNASKAFSQESLAPERSIAAIQKLRGEPRYPVHKSTKDHEQKPRSEDLEKIVLATEDRLGHAFEELERKLTFSHSRWKLSEQVRLHPYQCGFLALATGLVAGFVMVRKLRL